MIGERTEHVDSRRGHVSATLRQRLGPSAELTLTQPLQAAASRSGHRRAVKKITEAHETREDKQAIEDKKPKPPPIGSLVLDDAMLRRAFNQFDLDKNEVVGVKELKHLFAQLGDSPKDSELDGMIQLCDVRGDGAVQFEDFLAIFGSPSESLRGVDVEALQATVFGVEEEEPESSESEGSEEESTSGSSLEPR